MIKKLSALLIVLALVAAACGDDDGATTTEAEAATTTTAADAGQAAEGGILGQVKARGVLKCGVSGAAAAFSEQQADGSYTGFDTDWCRAVAAAVLGDANAVEFTSLTAAERFTAVQTGAVDVLMRNTTWTMSRDASNEVGLDFGPTTYYDGQQVMARAVDGFSGSSTIEDLEGAVVCTNAGTTTEKNITEVTNSLGVNINLTTYEDYNIVMDNFLAGACDAVTTDGSGLVGNKAQRESEDRDGSDWVIFPSAPISKEPLGPVYLQNDSEWADVVNWTVYAMTIFDEKGITSADADSAKASPPDGEVERLLGGEGELQSAINLPADAFYQALKQVGNYEEIYNRNLNPVGLNREGSFNAPFNEGGLVYAPPAR